MNVDTILKQREATHGNYAPKCETIQQLKAVIRTTDGFYELGADQSESLDMIMTKVGRILYGNPNHVDTWIDIAGYAQLIVDRLSTKSPKNRLTMNNLNISSPSGKQARY